MLNIITLYRLHCLPPLLNIEGHTNHNFMRRACCNQVLRDGYLGNIHLVCITSSPDHKRYRAGTEEVDHRAVIQDRMSA